MQPRAQHQSRIKLEHDFHIDQVEPEISNQKNTTMIPTWNFGMCSIASTENHKKYLKSDAPQGPTQIQNQARAWSSHGPGGTENFELQKRKPWFQHEILECVRWPANKITMRECFEAQGTQELPPDHQFKKPQPCPHHSFRKFKPVKTRAVNHNTPTEKDLDLWPHSSTAVKQQSSKAAKQQHNKAAKQQSITKIIEIMLIFYGFNEISMIFIDFHVKSIENQRKS